MRLQAGLTQAEVAARLQRPQSFVSKYESGERRLTLHEVRSICIACGTDLTRFVQRFERHLSGLSK